MSFGGRASVRHEPGGPAAAYWSAPPQHAGYRSGQTGHGDGWPERGGAGPQVGPHIPNLEPRSRPVSPPTTRRGERSSGAPIPRAPFTEQRAPVLARLGAAANRFRPRGR